MEQALEIAGDTKVTVVLRHIDQTLTHLAAEGVRESFRFTLRESGHSHLYAFDLSEGRPRPGDRERPGEVDLRLDVDDYVACMEGREDIIGLGSVQRIEVDGNLQLAMRYGLTFQRQATQALVPSRPVRYPCRERVCEAVAAKQPRIDVVEVAYRLPVGEFRRRHPPTGTPVLIKGALDDWEIMSCTPAILAAKYGDVFGLVRSGDYVATFSSEKRTFEPVRVRDYLATLNQPDDGTLPPYMAYIRLPFDEACDYPPYFERSEYRSASSHEGGPRFWLGPAGTVTPLHRDENDNLLVQIWGEKRVTLYSPDQRPFLSAWSTTPEGDREPGGTDVNPDAPDYESFPQFRQAHRLDVVIGPGDMLFIPDGWWHHVRSLSPSFSVNFLTDTSRASEQEREQPPSPQSAQ